MDSDPHRLLAAIDMGTSSFKLLLAQAQSPSRFIPHDRLSSPVLLGRAAVASSSPSADGTKSLPPSSIARSLSALRSFSLFLSTHDLPIGPRVRVVATSAVRSAPNRAHLLSLAHSELNIDIEVLSGHDEARLVYLGILQFLPVYDRHALAVDIGGGSTEIVLGFRGQVLFSASLDLGHVTLTESFAKRKQFAQLRRHIRTVLGGSGLVDRVKEIGFDVAVGSSGTVKSMEKAISGSDFGRKWKFDKEELRSLVEKVVSNVEVLGLEGVRRLGFSRRRSEFIAAGGILLMEIFEALGIQEIEVSGYALGEGVIAEMMIAENGTDTEFDLKANARWRSVVRLAVRFDCENRMKSAVQCVGVAKDIFYGIIRRCGVQSEDKDKSLVCLEERDFEYLEAAILLHNIGRVIGKKGYHKCSYQIIKNGGHIQGYSSEEIELIALLARFHRKKFPKCNNASLQELSPEMKVKIRVLCVILRLSLRLQQCVSSQGLEIVETPEGSKLVLKGFVQQLLDPSVQWTSATVEEELRPELEHFEEVFRQKISVIIP